MSEDTLAYIWMRVRLERKRQDEKFGDQSGLPRERMVCALVEEVGEVAEAVLANGKPRSLEAELVQVAALAVQMLEHLIGDDPADGKWGGPGGSATHRPSVPQGEA